MFGNQLLDMIFTPWATGTLFCANQLKIFTHLAEKPMTAEELSAKLGAVPRALTTLLDTCTALKLLEKKNNRYFNSLLSNIYLLEESPLYLGDIIEVLSIESVKWGGLYDLVMGNNEKVLNKKVKEIPSHRFTMAMNNLAMMGEADALTNAVDLSHAKKMVDAGCGSGIYSLTLCRHNPNLHATLLDKKEVLETTKKIIEKSNLQDRIKTRAADISKDTYGQQMDVVLLSDVLYQQDSLCLAILRSAYEALAPGGTLLVRGYYVYADKNGSHSPFGSIFNLHQLISDPKRKIISVSLLSQWIEKIGLKLINTFPLTERSHCLIAKR
ncbi:MAG: class I SAM-dependent methyltransferase [Candidatus Aminicenantes bacterium]|jgi:SAM-dependent methyltransferase